MKELQRFGKLLGIILVVQMIATGVLWMIKPLGEIFVYIFYAGPAAFLMSEGAAVKKEVSLFYLIFVPMVVWSVLISLGICAISYLAKPRQDKLS